MVEIYYGHYKEVLNVRQKSFSEISVGKLLCEVVQLALCIKCFVRIYGKR